MAGTWPRQSSPIRRRSPGHGDAIQQGRPAMAARWKNRPEGSNWGDFGPDDQRGRLNLLTPERVVAAAREVREGLRFCLSLPLDLPGGRDLNPRRFPPRHFPTERNGLSNFNPPLAGATPELTALVWAEPAPLCREYSPHWAA